MDDWHLIRFLDALEQNARTWGLLRKRSLPWQDMDLGERLSLVHAAASEGERRGYVRITARNEPRFYPSFLLMGHWPFTDGVTTTYTLTPEGKMYLACSRQRFSNEHRPLP